MMLRVEIVPPTGTAVPPRIWAEFRFDAYLDGPRVKPCECYNPLPEGKAPDGTRRAYFEGRIQEAISLAIARGSYRDGPRGQSIRHQFEALLLELPARLEKAVADAKRRGVLS